MNFVINLNDALNNRDYGRMINLCDDEINECCVDDMEKLVNITLVQGYAIAVKEANEVLEAGIEVLVGVLHD